ncbi:tyrosine-type recombinase/integrase [Thiocystis violacea]|uniref:tyrosine-type recombinase/integrase n=1 Tax=Thiocystis violacea TaxID=13725 RepID=UPI00190440F3|nr:tyrosine-type recombinase/integrase [Thiocystis violacea]MBK1723215.1 hypothetical protein [Thiocystis violacea]
MPRIAHTRRRLTKEMVSGFKPRASKFIVWDDTTPNLGLRVYPSGAKSYVLRLTFTDLNGKTIQRMETLGSVADFPTPDAARNKALELRQRYKAGEDVKATRQAAKSRDTTLSEALELYLAARACGTKPMKQRTADDYRAKMGYGLAKFMDKPLITLDTDTVIRWHRDRKLEAPTRADCEARYLRAVWNWTREELANLELPEWPTARWSKQKEWSQPNRRKRRLNRESAQAWMQTTQAWENDRDRALWLILYYTGWRIDEAMTLRWEDVDLERGRVWLRDTKTRDTYQLPLARQSVEVLDSLSGQSDWVFAAAKKDGGIGPMTHPGKAINRHRAQSCVEWSPHDLRRGFISVGESIGVPTAAVRRLTGHVVNQRDAHDGYIDFDADDLAPHVQRIADALEAMAHGTAGEIVDLGNRRASA